MTGSGMRGGAALLATLLLLSAAAPASLGGGIDNSAPALGWARPSGPPGCRGVCATLRGGGGGSGTGGGEGIAGARAAAPAAAPARCHAIGFDSVTAMHAVRPAPPRARARAAPPAPFRAPTARGAQAAFWAQLEPGLVSWAKHRAPGRPQGSIKPVGPRASPRRHRTAPGGRGTHRGRGAQQAGGHATAGRGKSALYPVWVQGRPRAAPLLLSQRDLRRLREKLVAPRRPRPLRAGR